MQDVACGRAEEVDGRGKGAIVVGSLAYIVGGLIVGEGVVAAEKGRCKGFG